jgi:uncharacterized protein
MPLFRFLLLALAIAMIVLLLRRLLSGGRRPGPSGRELPREDMVPCAQCGLHVPKSEALRFKDQYFCSDRHLQDYRNR